MTAKSILQDVVVATLAVYQCPLERLVTITDAMRARGLFDPEKLACTSIQALTENLKAGATTGAV
jgi:hypothetical protein